MSSWLRDVLLYRYYDTPEDRDCGKKIVYLARSSCLLGGFVGIHDVIANRHMIPSQTYTGWAIRGLSTAVPFVAAGSAFAAVTCLSTSFRGKDDEWNYWWGGVAAGCFAGIRLKNVALGAVASVLLGLFAVAKKRSKKDGWWNPWIPMPEVEEHDKFRQWRATLGYSNPDFSRIRFYEPRQLKYYFPGSVAPFPVADNQE